MLLEEPRAMRTARMNYFAAENPPCATPDGFARRCAEPAPAGTLLDGSRYGRPVGERKESIGIRGGCLPTTEIEYAHRLGNGHGHEKRGRWRQGRKLTDSRALSRTTAALGVVAT